MNGSENDSEDRVNGPDLGEPVAALLTHEIPVSPGFRARVSRSIERRLLAADATHFAMVGPFATLLELLRALFEGLGLVDSGPDRPTEQPEGNS